MQLLISQMRLYFISDNCLWVYLLQFWHFSINYFARYKLRIVRNEIAVLRKMSQNYYFFFFHHRIKNKKGNCDFLSHNSDISSQICMFMFQFWGYILHFLLFFLRIARKSSDTLFIFIPCQTWTSMHLHCKICKKTCCSAFIFVSFPPPPILPPDEVEAL